MKTAVVYYSMSGNTAWLAEEIARRTGADLIRIEPKKAYPDSGLRKFLWGGKSAVMGEKPELEPYSFCADAYDAVIVGSPVWAGRVSPPVLSFLTAEKDALKGKKVSAFLCHAGGGGDKALEQIRSLLGVESLQAALALTDPKEGKDPSAGEKIEAFCAGIGQ